ncbi:5-formyltetrahydrofolate cyclo-ligase [Dermabacter sp. HFH0086]|uniref:5-formyltetrahydrofolate cyclo-ligase n=1 Tax=Dermabacter TaxID=36739 RepID=UPI0003546635|nr:MULTISPECIES: 5-formyltetrahydrofolate cyclo-ligase [Dermabacter]EPH15798.1 5-formyltetrahydrofolate cyclo-ligase [Dermabacter sp. HFH0086]
MNESTTSAKKRALRREILRARRETYVADEARESAARIRKRLEESIDPWLAAAGPSLVIAGYSPVPAEASALSWLRRKAREGHTVILPTYEGELLGWRSWDGEESLTPSGGAKFGSEPSGESFGPQGLARADLIITPAVAVDRSGTRLGHGKGYYDRALAYARPETRVLTLIHETELLDAGSLPREEHDVPIPEVLTEAGLEILSPPV